MDYLPLIAFFLAGAVFSMAAHFVWVYARGTKPFKGLGVAMVLIVATLSAFLTTGWWYVVVRKLDRLIQLPPDRLVEVLAPPAVWVLIAQLIVGYLMWRGLSRSDRKQITS